MNAETLNKIIKSDNALAVFSAFNLPMSAMARTSACLQSGASLWRDITDEELAAVNAWSGGKKILDSAAGKFREGECCYYVFSDGSLYFASNADSEVWADANDFAVERIINGYDGGLDAMDKALLAHLGGFGDVIEERGDR